MHLFHSWFARNMKNMNNGKLLKASKFAKRQTYMWKHLILRTLSNSYRSPLIVSVRTCVYASSHMSLFVPYTNLRIRESMECTMYCTCKNIRGSLIFVGTTQPRKLCSYMHESLSTENNQDNEIYIISLAFNVHMKSSLWMSAISSSQRSMYEKLTQFRRKFTLEQEGAAAKALKKARYNNSCMTYSTSLMSFLGHMLPALTLWVLQACSVAIYEAPWNLIIVRFVIGGFYFSCVSSSQENQIHKKCNT